MKQEKLNLYRGITDRMTIVEDSYLIPDGEAYYGVNFIPDRISLYNEQGYESDVFDIVSLIELGDNFNWSGYEEEISAFFKRAIWMTEEAKEVLAQSIKLYDTVS